MGKAARLKRERRQAKAEQSKLTLANVEMDLDGQCHGTYLHDDLSGAMFFFSYENSQVFVEVSDPAGLVKPRSDEEKAKISRTVETIDKKLSSAIPEHIGDMLSTAENIIRTLIWEDDMLRKYVSEYRIFTDVVEVEADPYDEYEEDGEEMIEYNIAFAVSIGNGEYATIWYDDALAACDRSATMGNLSQDSFVDGLCPHCARNQGKVRMLTKSELDAAGPRATGLTAKLDDLIMKMRTELPLETLPRLVRLLGFGWEESPKGEWKLFETHEEDEMDAEAFDEDETDDRDSVFHEVTSWRDSSSYEFSRRCTLPSGAPFIKVDSTEYDENGCAVIDYGDGFLDHIQRSDISGKIGKPNAASRWSLPRGYEDIAHGTIYINANKTSARGRETRLVLTDSVDETVVIVDSRGVQRVEDRSLHELEDPTELERFAMKCEELAKISSGGDASGKWPTESSGYFW